MAQALPLPTGSVDWFGGAELHPYLVVDVFTSRCLEGNQLGVFLDARTIADEDMLRLTREMNFAETVFLLMRWKNCFNPSTALTMLGVGTPAVLVLDWRSPSVRYASTVAGSQL